MINKTEQIDVAVIGLGFGSAFAPIYQAHPAVGRVALVDTDAQRLTAVGDELSIADRFGTLDELLAGDGWDAVHLLTPVALHAEQVIQILESGRDVACAVPMATTLADLDRIIEVVERTGQRYMMMETTLFSREFFHARALLEAGDLGRLTYYRGEHLQNLDGYPPYWLGFPPMHYVTHALSPALALAGARAESVRCLGSSPLTPDHIGVAGPGFGTEAGLFRLRSSDPDIENDLVANITMSFFQLGRSYLEGFSVYGDAGALEWPQLEGGPMKEFAVQGVPGQQRGPRIDARDVHPPNRPDLLPESLHPFMDGGHGGSHPHLVHEFVSSIVDDRPARIEPRVAATLTAPGICAHDSALQGGADISIPDFGVVAR